MPPKGFWVDQSMFSFIFFIGLVKGMGQIVASLSKYGNGNKMTRWQGDMKI